MSDDLQSAASSTADFRVEGERLVVTVSGAFNIAESIRRFEAVIAACRMQSLTVVLEGMALFVTDDMDAALAWLDD